MADGMIIEVDEQDNEIGLRQRSDFYDGRLIHRASHLIVQNPRGEFLLQKRVATKRWYPGLWDFAVSETVRNESYLSCIIRGTVEELGVNIHPYELFKFFTSDEGVDRAWREVYTGLVAQREFPFSKGEIECLAWVSQKDLRNNVEEYGLKNYPPHFIKGMMKFFEL